MRKAVDKWCYIILACICIFAMVFLAWNGSIRHEKTAVLLEEEAAAASSGDTKELLLVDLNTADAETLELLPGIGPTIAARIVEYRNKNGGFDTADELMEVSGIGEKTYEKVKDMITVGGST